MAALESLLSEKGFEAEARDKLKEAMTKAAGAHGFNIRLKECLKMS